MGAFFTTSYFKEFYFLLALGAIVFSLYLMQSSIISLTYINAFFTPLFFLLVFRKLILYVLKEHDVNANSIFAAISGYLVMGITCASLSNLIEQSNPGAFHMPENWTFYDFIYFSFVSLTTVGYGDITPILPVAKSFTVMVSISGQLYLTILIAMIIGKYLANENQKQKS